MQGEADSLRRRLVALGALTELLKPHRRVPILVGRLVGLYRDRLDWAYLHRVLDTEPNERAASTQLEAT